MNFAFAFSTSRWAISDDISSFALWASSALAVLSLALLMVELRRRERGGVMIMVSGVLSTVFLLSAVLRPVHVEAQSTTMGPRVVALLDRSRRLSLPAEDEKTRHARAVAAVQELGQNFKETRLDLFGFSEGALEPLAVEALAPDLLPTGPSSDLTQALGNLTNSGAERPAAVVVISDGRLAKPHFATDAAALKQSLGSFGVPIHTVSLAESGPKDASILSVSAAGAAVAHQALTLKVAVVCSGLTCKDVPVVIRELRDGVAAAELARGIVPMQGETGSVELEITLDRAGARVVEVSIVAPEGDKVPENNQRYLTFEVARDRVRLLHLAGRPTYDVRALRMWLKSDESVDLVAFFILRGETDDPGASETDLALIRFPVDELFTVHLSSFDAVILQDIDAIRYKLSQYLLRLNQYVKTGGGLIMVGGPSSFAGGNYAGTPLDEVLPTEQPRAGKAFDAEEFMPRYTEAGEAASVTRPLRELLDRQLPSFAGVNLLGIPRPGSIVLLEHPKLRAANQPMPVLALGETGDGRSIALSVDSTYRLGFGELAASASGRAYGALWDGLLGWLMRDPRYEAARVRLASACIAGMPLELEIVRLPNMRGDIEVTVKQLAERGGQGKVFALKDPGPGPVRVAVGALEAGGYTAKVRIGAAPPTRHDFGCERGGDALSDSRPDAPRLKRIAEATAGTATSWDAVSALPVPRATEITSQRRTSPVLPAWSWTLAAALCLGGHWVARRYGGLA